MNTLPAALALLSIATQCVTLTTARPILPFISFLVTSPVEAHSERQIHAKFSSDCSTLNSTACSHCCEAQLDSCTASCAPQDGPCHKRCLDLYPKECLFHCPRPEEIPRAAAVVNLCAGKKDRECIVCCEEVKGMCYNSCKDDPACDSKCDIPYNHCISSHCGPDEHEGVAGDGIASAASGEGDEGLNEASEFLEKFSASMENTATIAKFFGPVGEAVAGVEELVGGITGLGSVLTKQPQKTDPLKKLSEQITAQFQALDAKFAQVETDVASLKKAVLKAEIAELFAKPEEVMLTVSGAVTALASNKTTIDQFVTKVKPLMVYSGDFSTSFGFIRDCVSGRNQACAIGGEAFVGQVGEALDYRPTQVASFFAYYQMLLVNAASAYCAFEVSQKAGVSCDPTYASSIADYAKATTAYFNQTLKTQFMCHSHNNNGAIPTMIAGIVAKHPNQGQTGATAITAALKSELETYYDPAGWYDYWRVSVTDPWSQTAHAFPKSTQAGNSLNCADGFATYDSLGGYNILVAFVPHRNQSPSYQPALRDDFLDLMLSAGCGYGATAAQRVACLSAATETYMFLHAYIKTGNWQPGQRPFWSNVGGGTPPGPVCSGNQACPTSTVEIAWFNQQNNQWVFQG